VIVWHKYDAPHVKGGIARFNVFRFFEGK
jgi:hypothetical protein